MVVRRNAPAKRVAIPYTEKNAATRAIAMAVRPSNLSKRMNRSRKWVFILENYSGQLM